MQTISDHPYAKSLSWGETAAGVLPLALMSLAITLEGSGRGSFSTILVWLTFFALYAVALAGILAAWARGFPRWSPPYLGLAVVDVLLFGFVMSGNVFESAAFLISLRLGVVLLLVFFALWAVALIRSKTGASPSSALDWTAFLFAAQVWMPIVVMVILDEIPLSAKTPLALLCGAILLAGALAYLRLRSGWAGALALAVSMALGVWSASYLAGWYWGAHPWGG